MTLSIPEQLLPNKGQQVVTQFAQNRIINTMNRQNQKGFDKYGAYLSTFNRRDSVRDMWEELADLINYAEALTQEYLRMRDMLLFIYLECPQGQKYMDEHFTEEELYFIVPGTT